MKIIKSIMKSNSEISSCLQMTSKQIVKKQEQREKEEADILQAAKDSYDCEIGAVFEKLRKSSLRKEKG